MVLILDTTLREGEQTPGVYFDTHVKLAIADRLDKLGVDIIEAGHPAVSDEIGEAVCALAKRGYRSVIAAHSRSMREDVDMAIDCGVGFIGIFYCVSDERLSGVFNRTLDTAIEQITDVIGYAKSRDPGIMVRYTPEDSVRSNFGNVVRASVAAVKAGADIISVADTTGYMVPGTERNMYDYVLALRREFDERGLAPLIAVHCHNDRGLALANALDAYRAGVDIIDSSVMGLGERAGIVDLGQLMSALAVDYHEDSDRWNLQSLPELYDLVSRYSGIPIPPTMPVMGQNAFTHCAGMHTHAVAKDPLHYHSLEPSVVGRQTEMCLDHMSGATSVRCALTRLGIEPHPDLLGDVTAHVKAVGRKGRTVDEEELRLIIALYEKRGGKGRHPAAQSGTRTGIEGGQSFPKEFESCFLHSRAPGTDEVGTGARNLFR